MPTLWAQIQGKSTDKRVWPVASLLALHVPCGYLFALAVMHIIFGAAWWAITYANHCDYFQYSQVSLSEYTYKWLVSLTEYILVGTNIVLPMWQISLLNWTVNRSLAGISAYFAVGIASLVVLNRQSSPTSTFWHFLAQNVDCRLYSRSFHHPSQCNRAKASGYHCLQSERVGNRQATWIGWLTGKLTDEAQLLYKLWHTTGTLKDTFWGFSKKENTVLLNMFIKLAKIHPPKAKLGV